MINIDTNTCYLLLPCGFGDTIIVSGLLEEIKGKYHTNVVLLIKNNHKIIMDMMNITNYITYDNRESFLSYCNEHQLISNTITPGKIYIAHPFIAHQQFWISLMATNQIQFSLWYRLYFGLFPNNRINLNIKNINHKEETKTSVLNKIKYELKDVILLLPNAESLPKLSSQTWDAIINNFKATTSNKKIISDRYISDNIEYCDLSIEEILFLADNVSHIISYRSGICDLLSFCGERLTVIYPSEQYKWIYSVNALFNRKDIKEISL